MGQFIVLMGMQGAGKGTQAETLEKDLGLPHVTSGGMFRAIKAQDTPLGKQIGAYLDKGLLVPDALTNEMIRARLKEPDVKAGLILDGYPRTVAQAQTLDSIMAELGERISLVPYLTISEAEAMERLSGRRVCTLNDNHVYHVRDNPPKVPDICDIDGARLKIRDDDKPEPIKQRIGKFKGETEPVLEYYRARGVLREINAEQPIGQVTADLKAALSAALTS